jgi:SPX domain protein involved in polyphosphate accumulation
LNNIEYEETIKNILDKIKNNKIKVIFNNIYKRLSFIYKNNPSIRITIDTYIEFLHNNIYNLYDKDILEIKIPSKISVDETAMIISNISNLSNIKLEITYFSKFEYNYYNVILQQ